MKIEQITAKDFKDAVDWLLKENQGCVHKVLATTDEGTQLCFVVGWSKAADFGGDDAKYGYVDDGYYIAAKIGYQHRNNGMQSDFDWDFNMPYDTETGDVWDTSSYVPRDADWEREAADYTSVAEKIWAAYGDPEDKKFWDDKKAPLDLMESKKRSRKCRSKKSEAASDTIRVTDEDVMLTVNEVDVDEHGGSFSVDTPEKGKSYDLREMKDMVKGMCEDCSGYSDISRDGSDVRIAVKAPESDKNGEFNGDYYDAFVMRCTARIVHVSLEGVVDYLAED